MAFGRVARLVLSIPVYLCIIYALKGIWLQPQNVIVIVMDNDVALINFDSSALGWQRQQKITAWSMVRCIAELHAS